MTSFSAVGLCVCACVGVRFRRCLLLSLLLFLCLTFLSASLQRPTLHIRRAPLGRFRRRDESRCVDEDKVGAEFVLHADVDLAGVEATDGVVLQTGVLGFNVLECWWNERKRRNSTTLETTKQRQLDACVPLALPAFPHLLNFPQSLGPLNTIIPLQETLRTLALRVVLHPERYGSAGFGASADLVELETH